ncbi:MAG: hypothetical protein F6K24_44045 [Okeania sp. SIO2D1]|nr:hypothetical protein [Okeania sp. SIO2D1]
MGIPELLKRYNLNSRGALYKRLEAVNIKLSRNKENKVFANTEQLHMLDDLNEHLEHGGNLSNYSPVYVAASNKKALDQQ